MSDYRHGAIWLINFEPKVGTEIKKVRLGPIISRTEFNQQTQKIPDNPPRNLFLGLKFKSV